MKRVFLVLNSLVFLSLWIVVSCGVDNLASKSSSSTSALGGQCACAATYSPVCGINNVTYDNSCIAKCYNVTDIAQGQCVCSQSLVCGSDWRTYTECNAQEAIRKKYITSIIKFSACNK